MQRHLNGRTRARFGARAIGIAALAVALTPAFGASAFAGPSPVLLGTAGSFAVLAGSGMTNTGVSTIGGDVGSSPTHSQTGFGPCPGANCVSLTGTNHDSADPNDAVTQQAKDDLTTAYNDALGRTGGTAVSAPLGGGTTLVAGVYTSAADLFVGGDLTLDGGGDPNAVFIFQAKTGTLTTAAGSASAIPNTRVLLRNSAQACNVFWQVGSSATISTSTQFVGTILANQSITVNTGATLDTGRTLARNGAVTLDTNTIRQTTCATPPAGDTTTPTQTTTTPAGGTTTPTTTTTMPGGDSTTPAATATTPAAAAAAAAVAALATIARPLLSRPNPTSIAVPTAQRPPGSAQLRGPSGPVDGPFTVSVTGRAIAQVIYYVDGKRRSTVKARPGRTRFSMKINPRRQSHRVHRVTARVTFADASRTRSTKLRLIYRRPAQRISLPRFTG